MQPITELRRGEAAARTGNDGAAAVVNRFRRDSKEFEGFRRKSKETMVPLPSSIDFIGIHRNSKEFEGNDGAAVVVNRFRRNSKEPGRIGRAYETPEPSR